MVNRWLVPLMGAVLATAACGSDVEQSAASGGLGGTVVGAAVGGPVGAAIGAGAGAAGGTGVEMAEEKTGVYEPGGQPKGAQSAHQARGGDPEVRRAQTALQSQGLYGGRIDGIAGPRTRQALRQYQERERLPQTARLDDRTADSLLGGQAQLPQREERRPAPQP